MALQNNTFYMSHSYFITTKKKMNIFDLISKLHDKQQDVDFIKIDNNSYIIFLPEYSTRGVEVTEANNIYTIKMNFLANSFDYTLCNFIAHILCKKLDGVLTNEEGKRSRIGKLFNEKKMFEFINKEVETVLDVLKRGKNIEITGPIRPFCIGKRIRNKVLLIEKEKYRYERAFKLSKFILDCQYPPLNFKPYYDMMENMVNDKKTYYAQVISNKYDIVIEKVNKYFISELQGNLSIGLTLENIVSIMPQEWVLLDEYTILAKKLSEERWLSFVNDARKIGEIME